MTLRFCDSFDHYNFARIALKWELGNSIANAGIVAGRNATSGLSLVSQGAGSGRFGKSFAGAQLATAIVGCAVNFVQAQGGRLFEWQDSVAGNTVQIYVQWDQAVSKLRIYRGDGTLMATSTATIIPGVWTYVEFSVTFGPAATGAFSLHINGAADVNGAAVQTRMSANSWGDVFYLGGTNNANAQMATVDDFYICDGLGARNNTFLGDVRIQALLPNGAGGNTAWTTLVGAATHWQATSDNPPDDDVSYIASATAGQLDTFPHAALIPTTGTIAAIQTVLDARKDDAGVRTIQPELRIGVTNYAVGAGHNVGGTYAFQIDEVELSPATAAPFTIAELNGAEIGANLVA